MGEMDNYRRYRHIDAIPYIVLHSDIQTMASSYSIRGQVYKQI